VNAILVVVLDLLLVRWAAERGLSNLNRRHVLAHEIGHYQRRHIQRMLALSALGALGGLYAVAWLARQPEFVRAFGFPVPEVATGFTPGNIAPVLLLFGLLSGAVALWASPLFHWLSRRHEYEADAFAVRVMKATSPLVGALRKLNEKNLSNLTPHPLSSRFYYSHPTLLEREAAIRVFESLFPACCAPRLHAPPGSAGIRAGLPGPCNFS
jgi:STE24 endopeptidase